jgi:lysophospholipase L1-like esterase
VAADDRLGDASGASRGRYFVDLVHLNAAGYAVVADCVVHTVRPLLANL